MINNNIVDAIQQKLGYPQLSKVDPNNNEPIGESQKTVEEKLAQSAIPVVLAGFFRFSRTEEGCQQIIDGQKSTNWLSKIFGDSEKEAVDKVSRYAGVSWDEAHIDMEQASREAFQLLNNAAGEKHSSKKLRTFIKNQRHNILVYLPAELQLGYLLHDNDMDDRTNKMEGPVSGFMHRMGDKLLGDET